MLSAVLRRLAPLPLAWLHFFGAAMGWLTYLASPTYARRLRENLRKSGVCPDEASYRRTLRAAVAEIGKGALELAAVWFRDEQAVAGLVVRCDGMDVVEAAQARGRGIIFLTPHFGCFEVTSLYMSQRMPLTVLYRPPRQRWLEPVMVAGRQRAQVRVAPATLRGVRQFLKALKQGEAVGVLPDQAPQAGEGVWADFFGRPAYTMTLVRRLQEATGASVIYVTAERLPRGQGFHMRIYPAPEGPLTEAAMNRAIEDMIRERPEQYLWGYNRYKVPAGARPSMRNDE